MRKARVTVGLTALLCILAVPATPAAAFFEAVTPGGTTGIIFKYPARIVYEHFQAGTATGVIVCQSTTTTKGTGFWTIQNSEETVVNNSKTKEQSQPATKLGPHEAILIQKWGGCSAKLLGGAAILVKVSECRLQVAQPGRSTVAGQEAFASFQTDCRFEVPSAACTLVIPQAAANHNLRRLLLTNENTNEVAIKANITAITDSVSGAGCAAGGIAAGTESTLKTGEEHGNEAIVTAGQKLV